MTRRRLSGCAGTTRLLAVCATLIFELGWWELTGLDVPRGPAWFWTAPAGPASGAPSAETP